jgi:hypothetical protein
MTCHPKLGPQGLLQRQVVFGTQLPLDGQPDHLSLMQEQPQGGCDQYQPQGLADHPLHQSDAALCTQPAFAGQQPMAKPRSDRRVCGLPRPQMAPGMIIITSVTISSIMVNPRPVAAMRLAARLN